MCCGSGERSRKGRARRTLDPQISTEKRLAQINIFDLDLHVVHLSLGLLRAGKATACSQKRRGGYWSYLRRGTSAQSSSCPRRPRASTQSVEPDKPVLGESAYSSAREAISHAGQSKVVVAGRILGVWVLRLGCGTGGRLIGRCVGCADALARP